MSAINFATILSVALLGSFGHCIGMCGGFVAALSSGKIGANAPFSKQLFFQGIYHLGRISSYALLGALCGLAGSSLAISPKAQGLLFFAIGCLMILMGVSLAGKIRFLSSIENSLLLRPFTKKIYTFLISSKNLSSFYLLGMFNGFVPCGLVYFFLASAAASGSVFWGALMMVVFGLATLPAMMGFGFVVGFLSFREIMIKLAGLIVAAYGIYIAYRGYIMVLG
ncbi:MAG: sulfite exporter TauE/SafE family protein [Campylobacteraceae bacterium]|jgi:sulfite exporter TauE/SafE|nr:sulfite exporter TauE/SafE family protein [Campylobacteraceae bacterium]